MLQENILLKREIILSDVNFQKLLRRIDRWYIIECQEDSEARKLGGVTPESGLNMTVRVVDHYREEED